MDRLVSLWELLKDLYLDQFKKLEMIEKIIQVPIKKRDSLNKDAKIIC